MISVFLDLTSSSGQNGLVLFLCVLYDQTGCGDACYQRLKAIRDQVDAALGGSLFAPPDTQLPLSLNHAFICYAPRDGADHAQRLHVALLDVVLCDHGLLRPGFAADVVVFDDVALDDVSTLAQPLAYCRGVEVVLVNGALVVDDGEHTGRVRGGICDMNKLLHSLLWSSRLGG